MSNELALTYLKIGNVTEASRIAAEAYAAFETLHEDPMLARVIETEAQIALASGDLEAAKARASDAIKCAKRIGNQKALISAHRNLSARVLRVAQELPLRGHGGMAAVRQAT